MDHAQQVNELTVLINRAKRAGVKVYHYPDQHLVVMRVTLPADAAQSAGKTPDGLQPATVLAEPSQLPLS